MKYITLGVIGHVDHGKTALVKALTGTDTDRLKEEKERGISIVLGYTNLKTPKGEIGIIDVPGHEKFIRTMISGATAIEAVLLVVDVNEGVKPQTIEHFEIADLLGIRQGIVAVTKCDAAQPGRREAILEDLEILTMDTFLENAPIVFTSAVSEEGLDDLKEGLEAILADSTPATDEQLAYLPIDRVFSMSGFGTVITGTLRRGAIEIGQEVEIYPRGMRAKVRELQTHNQFVQRIEPGFRCAVNLRGVEKAQLARGDVLATPGTLAPAEVLDARLSLLKSAAAPLKHGQGIRLLFGTQEIYPRVHLLDRDKVLPGEECVLQFKHGEDIVALPSEPFIIRTYSPMHTIGGGTILGTSDVRYRRHDDSVIARMVSIAHGTPRDIIVAKLLEAGFRPTAITALSRDSRLALDAVSRCLAELPAVLIGEEHVVHEECHKTLCQEITQQVSLFHGLNPTLAGMTKSQLTSELAADLTSELAADLDPFLLDHLIGHLEDETILCFKKGLLRLADFDPTEALTDNDRQMAQEIEEAFRDGAFKPPGLEDVLHQDQGREKIYRYLIDNDILVAKFIPNKSRTPNNTVVFHKDTIQEARRLLGEQFSETGRFSVPEAKDILNTSRKYLIPLLELLDTTGFSKRAGDYRVITRGD